MKYSILLVFVVFLSACVTPATNPFSPQFNPFNALQPQKTVTPNEGMKVSLSTEPSQVFSGSSAKIFFDAQNKDTATIQSISLDIFDTGNFAKESACQLSSPALLPDQIVSLSCNIRAPKGNIKTIQTEIISARAKFQSALVAVQSLDAMSEDVYNRQALAGLLKSSPRTSVYRDKNMEMKIEFSEELPIVIRKDKEHFVYFTITNIGGGFVDKITFGENFLPVEQKDLKFSEFQNVLTKSKPQDVILGIIGIVKSLFENTKPEVEEQLECKDILCCRNFGTIYPIGKTFPRIACKLNLAESSDYQLVDYQFIVPLVYNYEMRASTQLKVVR